MIHGIFDAKGSIRLAGSADARSLQGSPAL